MKYYFAPVQGHTDAPYRHFHSKRYGVANLDSDISGITISKPASGSEASSVDSFEVVYTTPFIRLEKGEIRKKDLKDIISPLNANAKVIPQVIFKNRNELTALINLLKAEGINRIDINMGCPFPLQTARGRGAASIANPECIEAVGEIVRANPDISFSLKMRLGFAEEEWQPLLEMLNTLTLDHISVHPRLAKDQYTPDTLRMEAFKKIYELSNNPIVYNGDILTPDDAKVIIDRFPRLHGIMIGRGALGRPSIFREISEGEWPSEKRLAEMKAFHRELINYFNENLIGGDHQVLSKIQPFWEYAEAEIGRKAWKGIKKASTISKYQTALALI